MSLKFMKTLKGFFTPDDERRILSAIRDAESRTSGEIRVRIERKAGRNFLRYRRKDGMKLRFLTRAAIFYMAVICTVFSSASIRGE